MSTFNAQPPRAGWPKFLQLVLCLALVGSPFSVLAAGGNEDGGKRRAENSGKRLRKSKSVPLSTLRPRGRRSSDNTGETSPPRRKRKRRITIEGRPVPARAISSGSSPSPQLRQYKTDPALLRQLWLKQKEEMELLWIDFDNG